MPLTTGSKLGPYDVLSPIGAGGMGEVYRARDARLGRDVALKVLPAAVALDPDRLSRFQREAQVLASLNHPNIAAIYGLEESALVMELVEGATLADRIAAGPLAMDDAVSIARQIAEALEYAHEKGIVHRDLKPANVKITPDGAVKVLDFGLAKAVERMPGSADPSNSPTLTLAATQAGVIMGTAGYMAPEQARGVNVDRRADIWSFGVVLYEMLSGKAAFPGDTTSDILAAVLRADVDFAQLPVTLPPWLRRLIQRCLTRDVKKRLQAIGEARLLIEDPPAEAAAPAMPQQAAVPSPKRRFAAALLVAGVIIGAAPLAFIHFREKPAVVHPVRFQVSLPQARLDLSNAPVLSPDSRYLAIVARDAGGKRMLWIRPLDSLEARQLPGTDGAYFPFWSPDSRSVGFATFPDLKMKKIDIGGGPPVTLASTQSIAAGAWSANGVILLGQFAGPLLSIPASGGEPKPLLELAGNELAQAYPKFLPGGRDFVYWSRRQDAGQSGVFLGSLQSKETRRLAAVGSVPSFVEPGFLLFIRGRTLFAQAFKLSARDLAGEAFPIADAVGPNTVTSSLFSASESGAVAFHGAGSVNKHLVWYERGGKRTGVIGESRDYWQFTAAPDGRRLALQERAGGGGVLWQFDLATGILSRLSAGQGSQDSLVWSPDGTEMIFGSNRGRRQMALLRKTVGSGEDRELFVSKENNYPEQWLREGSVLFINGQGKSFYRLKLEKDAKPETLLATEYAKDNPRVSPDGRWVAYSAEESGRWEIYVAAFPSFQNRRQVSGGGGVQPNWSKDGKELYYLNPDGVLMSVAVKPGPPLDTGVPQTLFSTRIDLSPTANQYAAFDGDRKFLVIEPVETQSPAITVILNWPAGLKK